MMQFNRFFYGIVFGSIIIWTIYLLTVDFYFIAITSYKMASVTNGPLPLKWTYGYNLGAINAITLFIIFCSTLLTRFKGQNLFD